MLPDDGHSSHDIDEVERLTVQAALAAENGDWDCVESCIMKRGLLFLQVAIPPSLAVRLRELDGHIEASMLLARTAAVSALAEIGRIRNNMGRLQQGVDAYQVPQSSIVNLDA